MKPKSKALNHKIEMSKSEFLKEHRGLVKTLKTGRGLKKEYKEQKAELEKYEK